MQAALYDAFNAQDITFSTRFSDSVLARIHFMIRIDPNIRVDFNFKEVEKELIEIGRLWTDDLQLNLTETYGEERANTLYARFKDAFPAVYRANFSPRTAVFDIKHIQELSSKRILNMNFYRPLDDNPDIFKLKIFSIIIHIRYENHLHLYKKIDCYCIIFSFFQHWFWTNRSIRKWSDGNRLISFFSN
jgi:glutamate dehydrogenase